MSKVASGHSVKNCVLTFFQVKELFTWVLDLGSRRLRLFAALLLLLLLWNLPKIWSEMAQKSSECSSPKRLLPPNSGRPWNNSFRLNDDSLRLAKVATVFDMPKKLLRIWRLSYAPKLQLYLTVCFWAKNHLFYPSTKNLGHPSPGRSLSRYPLRC